MQTRKRAKPVKFGAEEKTGKHVEKSAEEEVKQSAVPEDEKEEPASSENLENDENTTEKKDESAEAGSGDNEQDDFTAKISQIEVIEEVEVIKEDEEKELDEKVDLASPSAQEPASATVEEPSDKEEDDFFNVSPDNDGRKKSSFSYFFLVMFITFVVGFAFFSGIYYAVSNSDIKALLPSTESVAPTKAAKEVKPTVAPVDLSAYSIQVLNGSGVRGAAAAAEADLEGAGFQVASVGNADRDNYTNTQIRAKEEVAREYLDQLSSALKKTYNVDSTISKLASGSADVEVIIGSSPAN